MSSVVVYKDFGWSFPAPISLFQKETGWHSITVEINTMLKLKLCAGPGFSTDIEEKHLLNYITKPLEVNSQLCS